MKAASRMSKSNHKLMRLVRAKFEHASMVSDKVQNVEAFVKKYVYEYRVFGIRLHTFRNLEKKTIWIVAVLGTAGTVAVYYLYGLEEQVFQYAAWTGIGAVILCMVHILSDENYYQQMAENYMIDYLENVCAHRYAKLYKEKNVSQTSVLEMEETSSRRLRKKWLWQRWKRFGGRAGFRQGTGICHEAGGAGKRRKRCSGRKKTAGSAGAPDFRRIFGIILI